MDFSQGVAIMIGAEVSLALTIATKAVFANSYNPTLTRATLYLAFLPIQLT